jgi:hypothetical protein
MATIQRKRPPYLVFALLGALALGTTGACSGWATVTLYRDPVDPTLLAQGIPDEADRLAVIARVRAYLQALDAAKTRGWPLAVGTMLLGGAVFVFAMRAIGGNAGARTALVQLVVAQAGMDVASYVLMRDVYEANVRVAEAKQAADIHSSVTERAHAAHLERTESALTRAAGPVLFALRTFGSALVIVALTRRRSRELLDPPGEAVKEP